MQVKIPRNDREMKEISRVHTMTGWERAGYVASQVFISTQGVARPKAETRLSPAEFATKGIVGLRDKDTVRLYAERWRDHVGEPPKPGQTLTIPDLDWPPVPTGIGKSKSTASTQRAKAITKQAAKDGVGASKAIDIASNPKALAAAIKADPATAKAASEALAKRHDQPPPEREKVEFDFVGPDAKAQLLANRITDVGRQMQMLRREVGEEEWARLWTVLADPIASLYLAGNPVPNDVSELT